jgi:peptidoglycan/xylan/chitin deacetylase (PgdA/CDA1 family)
MTFDPGVVDVSPEQLGRQLAFLRRWFEPIGIDQLRAFAAGRGRLPRNPVMVTFDDGYRDNHDVALPILLQHGVRATFFIATDYVENRRMYWWDRVSLLVERSTHSTLELVYPMPRTFPMATPAAKRETVRKLQRIIKDERGLDLERFLDGVARAAGVSLSPAEERRIVDATTMTWDHVRALRRAGMDIQSHTRTHRVLQTLDPSDLDRELRASKTTLEDVLGERITAVSYPVGKPLGEASHIRRAVREAGYELGFSNATGVNRARALDPIDVKRLSLDLTIRDPFFRAMLALPWFAY